MMSRCFLCCFDHTKKTCTKLDDIVVQCDDSANELDAAMGMNAYDRKLVKETSDIVFNQLHMQDKSVTFLIAFFKRYPHHQRYFKMFRDIPPDELHTLPLLENHGRRVMDQMMKLVQNMEDLEEIQEQLSWISMKHKPRKVRSRQFKDMLAMFVEFMGQEMGARFTAQHELAWQRWLAYILVILEKEEICKISLVNGKVNEHGQHPTNTPAGDEGGQAKAANVERAVHDAEPDISLSSDVESSNKTDPGHEIQIIINSPENTVNTNTNSNTNSKVPGDVRKDFADSDNANESPQVESSPNNEISNSDQKVCDGVLENIGDTCTNNNSGHPKGHRAVDIDMTNLTENNTNNVKSFHSSDNATTSLSNNTNNLKNKTEHDLADNLHEKAAENVLVTSDTDKQFNTSPVASSDCSQAEILGQGDIDKTLQDSTASGIPGDVIVERVSRAEVTDGVPEVVIGAKTSVTPSAPSEEDSVIVRA